MLISNNIAENLFKRKTEIILRKIFLLDPSDKRKSLVYGYGLIRQDEKHQINFVMYINRMNKKIKDVFELQKSSRDNYNFFRGIDTEGRKWNFKNTFFSTSHTLSHDSHPSIYGEIKELDTILPSPPVKIPNYLEFGFTEKFKFPFTDNERIELKSEDHTKGISYENIIKIDLGDIKIESQYYDSILLIRFITNNIKKNYEYRILESLKFITGQQLKPYYVEICSSDKLEFKIFGDHYFDFNHKIKPPIKIHKYPFDHANDAWKLFKQYLDHIKSFRGEFLSPLGTEFNSIRGSASSFFETKILILCIRTEGILHILFPEFGKPSRKVKSKVSDLLNHIKDWYGDENIKNRSLSAIGNMKNARVKDKMLELQGLGVINKTQLDSWEELRNKSAHGADQIKENQFKEINKKYNNVVELLFRIVLYALNHKGYYTSYSNDNEVNIEFRLYS